MEKPWDLLVISPHFEDGRALLQILESLPINVFRASTIEQAIEVLSRRSIRLVFCEEMLAHRSFPTLFASNRDVRQEIRLILDGRRYVLIDPLCGLMEGVVPEDQVECKGHDSLSHVRPN